MTPILVLALAGAYGWRAPAGFAAELGAPARQVLIPTTFTSIGTDPDEPGCNDHRNVSEAFYAVEGGYLFLRLTTFDPAGWPSTQPQGQARYKWFLDVDGDAVRSGGSILNAEYQLILEDLTQSPEPTLGRNQLGELTLLDDLLNVGFTTRWGGGSPPGYTTNAPASPSWVRVNGSGVPGVGGPQGINTNPAVGYRILGSTVDMYVSLAALGNPAALSLLWSTDNHDNNLDQSPNCDRPDVATFVALATPTPTATSTSTPSPVPPTATPTATRTATTTPTPTASLTPTSTPSPTVTLTPSPGPSPTPTATPTLNPEVSAFAGTMVGGEQLGGIERIEQGARRNRMPMRGSTAAALALALVALGLGAVHGWRNRG